MSELNEAAAPLVVLLLASSLKASLAFLLALGAAHALRQCRPEARHLLWLCAVAAYPLALLLSAVVPGLPVSHWLGRGISSGPLGVVAQGTEEIVRTIGPARVGAASAALSAPAAEASAPAIAAIPWYAVALITWVAGVAVTSAPAIAGRVGLLLLRREARPAPPGERRLLSAIAAEVGVSRAVRLMRTSRFQVPFSCGLLRPTVFLPGTTAGVTAGHLREIFHHELRHVRRLDGLSRAVGLVTRSLFWFVPLVWIAFSRQLLEQERACDIGVVQSGAGRRRYATFLLDTAAGMGPIPAAAPLLAGGRRKALIARITSIMQGGKSMKKRTWFLAAAVAGVAAVVLLTAMATGGRAPALREPAAVASAVTAAGGRTIVVATDPFCPPFEMLDESKQIVGFDVDLLQAAAKAGGFKVEIRQEPWTSIFAGLQHGSYDAIASCLSIVDERRKTMDFSIPYFKSGAALIVRKETSGVRTFADLKGKIAVTQSGSWYQPMLKRLGSRYGFDTRYYFDLNTGLREVMDGSAAAYVYDGVLAKYQILEVAPYKGKLKIDGPLLNEDFIGIAVKKGNREVLELINAGLKKVIDSGEIKAIEKKWLG